MSIFILIFISKLAKFQVSSQIFTTLDNSIGNKKFSFPDCISFIHIRVLNSIHFETQEFISVNAFS
ncbi:MAG: hypothetical protein LBQ24_07070 [Candidatus Peribacteria bacterium]|nr:hypothetical protein [Candidatus Peribacteria bacterium]